MMMMMMIMIVTLSTLLTEICHFLLIISQEFNEKIATKHRIMKFISRVRLLRYTSNFKKYNNNNNNTIIIMIVI